MQRFRHRFRTPDHTRHGSLQSCIRTNDLELVGDGSHLTYFQMLGNFSFGGGDYSDSVRMWDRILDDLGIKPRVTEVRVHPSRPDQRRLWDHLGYSTLEDGSCEWSDGLIGGTCSEVFVGSLELGNLVNPLGHSTDVGFGWERIIQLLEGVDRVDGSSLFRQDLHPIVRDHSRTIDVLYENRIDPGNKGRRYVCRRLLRRIIPRLGGPEEFRFQEWLRKEKELREEKLKLGRRMIGAKRFRDRPSGFWWETFGLLPEEVQELREQLGP
jgi:alanyl-tRNA synthetase